MLDKSKSLLLLSFIIMVLTYTSFSFAYESAVSGLEIGDYIQYGSYKGEPILWRVINSDHEGDPILYSHRILTMKAFDTVVYDDEQVETRAFLDSLISEGTYDDFYNDYFSNSWRNSTIRQWLNSDQKHIQWINKKPSKENVYEGLNPYDTEPGFLNDFTTFEKSLIKPTEYVFPPTDFYDESVEDNIIQDLVFLYSRSATGYDDWDFGEYVFHKKPTTKAVEEYAAQESALSPHKVSSHWLSFDFPPDLHFRQFATLPVADGHGYYLYPDRVRGVAPGLTLKSEMIALKSGSGRITDPYILTEGIRDNLYHSVTFNVRPENITYEVIVDGETNFQFVANKGKVYDYVIKAKGYHYHFGDFEIDQGTLEIDVDLKKVAPNEVGIGEYLYFDFYNEEPILWQVLDLDERGNPLLYSHYILTLKAFDASGAYHPMEANSQTDVNTRRVFGSNYWKDSTIRQWLNSSEQVITWLQNPPSRDNVLFSENPYEDEPGFLFNFTDKERSLIRSTANRIDLHARDKEKHNQADSIILLDQVCLLSKEEHHLYHKHKLMYVKEVTQAAYDKTSSKSSINPYTKKASHWLRNPGDASSMVWYVFEDGMTNYPRADLIDTVANSSMGIAPALTLELSRIEIAKGTGAFEDPYVLATSSLTEIDELNELNELNQLDDEEPEASLKGKNANDIEGLVLVFLILGIILVVLFTRYKKTMN